MNEVSRKKINKDYIGIVVEENNSLITKQVEIPQDEILLKELRAMVDNDNRTVIDLQNAFTNKYPEKIYNGKYYDYIYPYSYSLSYVSGAGYPKLIAFEEYKKDIEEYENNKRQELFESEEAQKELAAIKEESVSHYQTEVQNRERQIRKDVQKHKNFLKSSFANACDRFIAGHNYTETLSKTRAKLGSNLRMFSSEKVGWSRFKFPLNRDVAIDLMTNFGYGSAAYFFCNLTYKGINFLPYSAIVHYYYVNWLQIIRYTRKYPEQRESWDQVFDFVTETGNFAKNNPREFVHKWIISELDEMLQGLNAFMSAPKKEFRRYYNIHKQYSVGLYMLVRNIGDEDRLAYKILPQEAIMALKAEKITGSLYFLENLKILKEINPQIQHYINEILSLNRRIKPEIIQHINWLEGDVNRLNRILATQEKRIESYETQLEPFKKEIEKEEEKQKLASPDTFSHDSFINKYRDEHKEYVRLMSLLNKKRIEKNNTEQDIKLRQTFKEKLNNNLQLIKEKADAA